jgi:hypothetical protein
MYHDGEIGASHFTEHAASAFFRIFYDGITGVVSFQDFLGTESNADATLLTPPPIYLNIMHILNFSEAVFSFAC